MDGVRQALVFLSIAIVLVAVWTVVKMRKVDPEANPHRLRCTGWRRQVLTVWRETPQGCCSLVTLLVSLATISLLKGCW
jgi:hypothetical protein